MQRASVHALEKHAPAHQLFVKIGCVALVIVAAVIPASCSEKSGLDRNENSQVEEAKPGQGAPALREAHANESGEHSARSKAERSEAKGENEMEPTADEIAEDCVAFLRSTKTVPADSGSTGCPQCPPSTEATEVLKFEGIRVDRVARSESNCEVNATIHATFNPSTREIISGGLTAWISAKQKAQYLQGETPSDQQVYKLKVIYKRNANGWRAVEFDQP